MSVVANPGNWTEEQLMSLPDIGHKYELVNGRLIMAPAGSEHGGIAAYLGGCLAIYARERKLGWVFDSSTGFWMKSGNLRCPDVSFVSTARLGSFKRDPKRFFQGSPDLAVEILSPSDTVGGTHDRIVEYFENDTRLAWLVSPSDHTVTIYRDARPDRLVRGDARIEGEDVVKGFSIPLAELFATPE